MYIASRVTERLRILGKLGKIRKILKSHSIILPSAQFPLKKKKINKISRSVLFHIKTRVFSKILCE